MHLILLFQVILATNIAETSITINGIVHVIDPGMVKQRRFNPRTGLDLLSVQPIAKAQVGGGGGGGWKGKGYAHAHTHTRTRTR